MEYQVKVGDIVRHRHILRATNLSVVSVDGDHIIVRYANDGVFLTQELFAHEVEVLVLDKNDLL